MFKYSTISGPMAVVGLTVMLALGACSSGGDGEAPPPMVQEPTPYETAKAAIAAATTAEAAQAAYDAVKDDVTAAQGSMLQAAVDARIEALAMMGRAADQRMALMAAAGAIDTSDLSDADAIAAANTAIAALKAAIAAAVDVDDTSMYQAQVDAAETAVANAQSMLDHAAQTMALSDAVGDLQAIDLTALSTQAAIDAAQAAIDALQAALDGATELSAAEKTMAMTELGTARRTVMTAQGTFDTNAQKMALADAVATLAGLNLDNLMTQEDIDAAVAAITGVNLALAAATNLTDAEKLDATVDVTVAQRKVDRADETLTANVDSQRMALMTAGTALAALDLDDLDTQEKIDAADAAVDDLEMALAGATHLSDSEKATYQTQLSTAMETVRTAQTGMDRDGRMMTQRTAITSAVTMARTAVGNVDDDSTDSEVASADAAVAALKKAIEDAEDLPEGDADVASAQGTLDTLEPQLAAAKTSRETAMAEAEENRGKANAKLGKDMRAALAGPTAAGNALDNTLNTPVRTGLQPSGLDITRAPNAGTNTGETLTFVAAPTIAPGDSAGELGSWNGTNYVRSTGTGDDKVTWEARVYTNKGPGKTEPFAEVYDVHTDATAGDDVKGYYTVDETGDVAKVGGAVFMHSGTQTHTYDTDTAAAFTARGTFDGAPGQYRCTGACSSTNDGSGSPSALAGVWHFKPDTGAMATTPDAHYLHYGWWVTKDKDGVPTAASAFTSRFGNEADVSTDGLDPGWTGSYTAGITLTGSATYAGHAAGKFAISNPLDSTGNGGHFTADAMLNAKFDGTGHGVTGTIGNFRLNDGTEDAGWSVELHRADFGDGGAISAPVDDANTDDVNEAMGTTWSMGDNSAGRSGTWSGAMYDEAVTGTANDGSNIPTTVTGTFYSEFSSIGRMVGAFGADKQ